MEKQFLKVYYIQKEEYVDLIKGNFFVLEIFTVGCAGHFVEFNGFILW